MRYVENDNLASGQVLGAHCKHVLAALLDNVPSDEELDCRAKVAQMTDEAWYPLEDCIQMTVQLKKVLPDSALSLAGSQAALQTLQHARARGLRCPEQVLGQLDTLLRDVLRDLAVTPTVRAVALQPGSAILETPLRLPPALLLGAVRGVVLGFGKSITSESVMRQGTTTRLHLTWR